MATRRIKCKFCSKIYDDLDKYAAHMEKSHVDMIPPDMTPRQFIYFLRTGKTAGSCVMCKKPTKWNEKTNKYHRFCENPECKEKYREEFKKRMMDTHGKVHLLNDPEQQRIMLARRSISKEYHWSDYKHVTLYTGTYERAFLVFLDSIDFDPTDVIGPSPHNYFYFYEGKRHFYFPDFFIPSLNLEIEIKDGGDNPNNHPKIQAVDKEKERLKDEILCSKQIPFNYLKISDKKNIIFLRYLDEAKRHTLENDERKIIMI